MWSEGKRTLNLSDAEGATKEKFVAADQEIFRDSLHPSAVVPTVFD